MNPAERLGSEFDTPREFRALPVRSLLICSSPRTGGHALCAALWDQGWGMPMEYFNPDFMIPLQQRWIDKTVMNFPRAKDNLEIYGRLLIEKRSTHVIAVKLFWEHLTLYQKAFANSYFETRYIHLTRRDKISQTISLAATMLTGRAFNDDFKLKYVHRIAHLDNEKILKIYDWLASSEFSWRAYLACLPAANVMELEWEDFQSNPGVHLKAIADKLSLPFLPEKIGNPGKPYNADLALKRELREKFGDLLKTHELTKGPS